MPQPLKALADGDYEIHWDAVEAFDRYPELGLLVAKCNAAWASVEQGLGHFVADALGANAKVALAMLDALISTSAKIDAIDAMADIVLPSDHRDRPFYGAALKVYKAQAKRRNKLVHHIWGIETKHTPDKLILTDPSAMTDRMWRLKYNRTPQPNSGDEAAQEWLDGLKLAADSTFTYSKTDLKNCLRDFRETGEIWFLMSMLIDSQTPDWIQPKARTRQWLSEKPLMVEALPR
jgi:hypothetical protein